jgi:hypothetical protein
MRADFERIEEVVHAQEFVEFGALGVGGGFLPVALAAGLLTLYITAAWTRSNNFVR